MNTIPGFNKSGEETVIKDRVINEMLSSVDTATSNLQKIVDKLKSFANDTTQMPRGEDKHLRGKF